MTTPRADNFAHLTGSLGTSADKATGAEYRPRRRLDRATVEALIDQNEICAKAAFRLVDDAFRRPGEGSAWTLKSRSDEDAIKGLQDSCEDAMSLTAQTAKAARWSRQYGAAALVLPIRDGRTPDQPVDVSAIQSVTRPTVVPAYSLRPELYDAAFGSPTYREILQYSVQSLSTRVPEHKVDASRVILFEAITQPLETRIAGMGISAGGSPWGPSVLQRFYDELLREGTARGNAGNMLYTASLLVLHMEGMGDKITTEDGRQEIRENMTAIRETLDVNRILALDVKDVLSNVSRSFSGVPAMLAVNRDALGAALPHPREICLNEVPPNQLGSTLSGAQALFFSQVQSYRDDVLAPALLRCLGLHALAVNRPLPRDAAIAWAPLWIPDEKEASETNKRNVETDKMLHEISALGAQEIRTARLVAGARGMISVPDDAEHNVRKARPYLAPALEIVAAVTAGTIPRDAGEQLLIAGGYDVTLLGSAGT